MDINISISVSLVVAVLAAELVSFLYYSLVHRHDLGDRYVFTGLLCDVIMAFLLQHITKTYYSVRKWEDTVMLSGALTLFFACLTAPHFVHDLNSRATKRFFVEVLHKFAMLCAMALAMLFARDY